LKSGIKLLQPSGQTGSMFTLILVIFKNYKAKIYSVIQI
jgi:hypothetical protein